MILSFTKDQFKDRILSGSKKQTIRRDLHNRWRTGMNIEFWKGSPRNKWRDESIHQFATGTVKTLTGVIITKEYLLISTTAASEAISDKDLLNDFAKMDGFDTYEELLEFFSIEKAGMFKGVIITWDQPVNEIW